MTESGKSVGADGMGNLEKLGILVIVILVVVVGVVAITPHDALFGDGTQAPELATAGDEDTSGEFLPDPDSDDGPSALPRWPDLEDEPNPYDWSEKPLRASDPPAGDDPVADAPDRPDDIGRLPIDLVVDPPAADPEAAPEPAPVAQRRTYTIRKGDSLYEIAKRELGAAKHWKAIAAANPAVDPSRLQVGDEIDLPSVGGSTTPTDAPRTIRREGTPPRGTYVVKAGETLGAISQAHYGTSKHWRAILAANQDKIDRPEDLQVGMDLVMPAIAANSPVPRDRTASEPRSTEPRSTERSDAGDGHRVHTVTSGESLSTIAQKVLGKTARWSEIYELNRGQMDDPDDLKVGQKLRIPR